jgi:hypothetical protein
VSVTSTSHARLKEQQETSTAEECASIVDAVEPKRCHRNDTKTRRVGFVAQELQEVCQGDFAHIVGETPAIDELSDHWLAVEYRRLGTILWKCVKDLRSRVTELEQATYASNNKYVFDSLEYNLRCIFQCASLIYEIIPVYHFSPWAICVSKISLCNRN